MTSFPLQLYRLLEDAAVDESKREIVSWLPSGVGFKIHRPATFVEHLLPRYFKKQTRIKSFTRQLYAYGFSKINEDGPFQGAFTHELFVRGEKSQVPRLKRNSLRHDRRFKQFRASKESDDDGEESIDTQRRKKTSDASYEQDKNTVSRLGGDDKRQENKVTTSTLQRPHPNSSSSSLLLPPWSGGGSNAVAGTIAMPPHSSNAATTIGNNKTIPMATGANPSCLPQKFFFDMNHTISKLQQTPSSFPPASAISLLQPGGERTRYVPRIMIFGGSNRSSSMLAESPKDYIFPFTYSLSRTSCEYLVLTSSSSNELYSSNTQQQRHEALLGTRRAVPADTVFPLVNFTAATTTSSSSSPEECGGPRQNKNRWSTATSLLTHSGNLPEDLLYQSASSSSLTNTNTSIVERRFNWPSPSVAPITGTSTNSFGVVPQSYDSLGAAHPRVATPSPGGVPPVEEEGSGSFFDDLFFLEPRSIEEMTRDHQQIPPQEHKSPLVLTEHLVVGQTTLQ